LLNQSKAELEAYAKVHRLTWIEDPSNQSRKYKRNAIRKDIIPKLEKIQPEAIANLARSAQLLGEAQTLLDRLAMADGKAILSKESLKIQPLLKLAVNDLPAANNVLRYWLKLHQLAMPSQERLHSWWVDLRSAKPSAQLEWQHDGVSIRLWREQLQIASPQSGSWFFKIIPAKSKLPGLPTGWVKAAQERGSISQRERLGSEKLQIKANSPRKTLKNLFQEGNIPPWEREAPLLYIGDELIAVAG
jgi:tRNA(Ile)-lysidine synthase